MRYKIDLWEGSGCVKKARWDELIKLRSLANYQFGSRIGEFFFPEDIAVTRSKKTGRIRDIYYKGELIAIYRPRDGLISLSLAGAKRFFKNVKNPPSIVVVMDGVEEFVRKGKTVFAKHIVEADAEIRPQDEAFVVNRKRDLLAVGRASLSGEEMMSFKKGIAVRVRKGVDQ